MARTMERVGSAILFLVPFVGAGLVAARPLREHGWHHVIGVVVFGMIVASAWALCGRSIRSASQDARLMIVSGLLLIAPFATFSLLWVGLGPPWEANAAENRMRYLVLLCGAVSVTTGFVILKEILREAGERVWSTVGLATNLLAGAVYVLWLCFQVGLFVVAVRAREIPTSLIPVSDVFDILLFVACVLTYVTTALFAVSLRRAGWLGRRVGRGFVLTCLVALAFIIMRGLAFPDPTADDSAWYLQPGFIAGVPAVPWIMPHLIGVVLLRRYAKP